MVLYTASETITFKEFHDKYGEDFNLEQLEEENRRVLGIFRRKHGNVDKDEVKVTLTSTEIIYEYDVEAY